MNRILLGLIVFVVLLIPCFAQKPKKLAAREQTQIKEKDVDIEYAWSLIGVESLDGLFYVTNNTDETVRYSANNFSQINPFWIKQNGKSKKVALPYLVGVDAAKEQELKPNESTSFSIPVPQSEKPFKAGFIIQIGDERKEKIIWVNIEKQLKSSGLSCTEEIKKAGGVLSKTCITRMPKSH